MMSAREVKMGNNEKPCEGNCFAVKKLLNKLEKEVDYWKDDAAFWERSASRWRQECGANLSHIPAKAQPKIKKRLNLGHLKLASSNK